MHDGKVTYYIGRTVNTESAKARHKANPNRNHLQFDVIKSNLSYLECRSYEQYFIQNLCLLKPGKKTFNQINGVSSKPKNQDIIDFLITIPLNEHETSVGHCTEIAI